MEQRDGKVVYLNNREGLTGQACWVGVCVCVFTGLYTCKCDDGSDTTRIKKGEDTLGGI